MDALLAARGLLAGMAATLMMFLVEVPAAVRWGRSAVFEWDEAGATARRLLRRQAFGIALALHVLGGGLAGIVFVVGVRALALAPGIAVGAAYGSAMWVVTLVIHERVTGVPAKGVGVAVSLASHLVFGSALGLLAAWANS